MHSGKSVSVVRLMKAICAEAREAWRKTYDLKRKASEAQENLLSHLERTRRISNEHARAEALVNDSLGTLVQAVRDAAAATHSLTCRSTGQRE